MELRLGNEKSAADAGDWNSSKKNDARKKRTNGAAEKKKGGRTYFPSAAAANKSQFLSRSMSVAAQGWQESIVWGEHIPGHRGSRSQMGAKIVRVLSQISRH